MRIVEIREKTAPVASPIANATIDFSKITCSVVAVVTDAVRDGKPVVGFGFNSNGRHGQGALMRERFIPRTLVGEANDNLDPHKIWARLMANEKPGGHGERSVAVGTIDMAVWDAVAKIAGVPLFQLLAQRHGDGRVNRRIFVCAAVGYCHPGKDLDGLKREMRSYLDRGYTVVKMNHPGASSGVVHQRSSRAHEPDRQRRRNHRRRSLGKCLRREAGGRGIGRHGRFKRRIRRAVNPRD